MGEIFGRIFKSATITAAAIALFSGAVCEAKIGKLEAVSETEIEFSQTGTLPVGVLSGTATSEKDKLFGRQKNVLFVDAAKIRGRLEFFSLTFTENVAEISFSYKILDYSRSNAGSIRAEAGYMDGDKFVVVQKAPKANFSQNKFRMLFRVASDKKLTVKMFLDGGTLASIGSISIKTAKTGADSDWLGADKRALDTLRWKPTSPTFARFDDIFNDMSESEFFPFVDKFGQFKHRQWKNKVSSVEELEKRLAEEIEFLDKTAPVAGLDRFFGRIDPERKYAATGRFRVEKIGGKWFFITPDGNLFWSLGADCVGGVQYTPLNGREHFFEEFSGDKYFRVWNRNKHSYSKDQKIKMFSFDLRNRDLKYPAGFDYAAFLKRRARVWGINTFGAWSQMDVCGTENVPFTFFLNSGNMRALEGKLKTGGHWGNHRDFFDPAFERNLRACIKANAKTLSSSFCIGAFVDNELPWCNKHFILPKAVLSCPADQPAKLKFAEVLKSKYGDISALNKAWGSRYVDWAAVLAERDFFPSTDAGKADMLEFEDIFIAHYYKTCRDLLREFDPKLLYLGSRFCWHTELVAAPIASRYCDVVSFNCYRYGVSALDTMGGEDKPILIGEFHYGDQSRGVFGASLVRAADEKSLLRCFKNYVESALKNPAIVGVHWFQFGDQTTTGRFDGENFAMGIVDITDTPHYKFVKCWRKVADSLYDLRLNSPIEKGSAKTDGDDQNY